MKVQIKKFNENHDELGRFSSAGGGGAIGGGAGALQSRAKETWAKQMADIINSSDSPSSKKAAALAALKGASAGDSITVSPSINRINEKTTWTKNSFGEWEPKRYVNGKADTTYTSASQAVSTKGLAEKLGGGLYKVTKSEDATIEKFNPFHDHNGKFSSYDGFTSFSANPYTKAGQMAIQRAAQGQHPYYRQRDKNGHIIFGAFSRDGKNIRNVHANSKTDASGQAHTNAENIAYLRGKRILIVGNQLQPIGGTAAANKLMRAAMNEPLPPKGAPKPATQTQAKPKQQAKPNQQAQQQQNQNGQQNQQAPSQQQNQQQRQVGKPYANAQGQLEVQTASGHTYYQGQDRLQEVIQNSPLKNGYTYQQLQNYYNEVCDLQGFHNKPELVQDQQAFKQATTDSGYIGYRSKNSDTYLDSFAKDQTYTEGGNGGRSHDEGTYIVTNRSPQAGVEPSQYVKQICSRESAYYGTNQVKMTFQKGMKTITEDTARRQFNQLTSSERRALGNDLGLFCAAKGYDAMVYHVNGTKDYFMLHNRSKAVVKQRSSGRITYPSNNSNGYL